MLQLQRGHAATWRRLHGLLEATTHQVQLHGEPEDAEALELGDAGEGESELQEAEARRDAEVRLQLDCTQRTSTQMSRYEGREAPRTESCGWRGAGAARAKARASAHRRRRARSG